MKLSKKFALFLITASLSLASFAVGFAAASSDFSDVSEDDWYYSAVTELSDYGLLQGYSDSTFRASNDMNRAEMAVMFARMVDLLKYHTCVEASTGKLYLEGDDWDDGETMYECVDGSIKEVGAIN